MPPKWTKWISKDDLDHISAVEQCVVENMLPASAALDAVDTQRIAAEAEYRATGLARSLQDIRNVGVLAPIMVTWVSFALASSAYNLSINTQDAQSQGATQAQTFSLPLLQQWERGFTAPTAQFGPIPIPLIILGQRWFTFSHFAIVDALLILGLVIITFVAQRIEGVGLNRARETMRGVEIRLFQIATHHGTDVFAGKTIEDKAQAAFDRIAKELGNFNTAINAFTSSMRDVPEETLRLVSQRLSEYETQQTGRLVEVFTQAASAQAQTNQAIKEFVSETASTTKQVTASVQELKVHWSRLTSLEEGIEQTTREANKAVGAAGELSRTLSEDIRGLSNAQREVTADLKEIASSYRESVDRLANVGNAFNQTTQMQQDMRDNLATIRDQINALKSSSKTLEALFSRIENLERAMGVKFDYRPKRRFGPFSW